MNYNVIWLPDAERELTDLWLHSPDRGIVTKAAAVIDRLLERNPEYEGESRTNDQRILFASPLAVIYRLRSEEREVAVLHVWRFRTSRA
jgi:plasmid stabilization system protein ParE